MAHHDILNKLNSFLETHSPFSEECHAVYLMVEIRKILEQNGHSYSEHLYPLLKFYCDWSLHTKKNRITPQIEQILGRIDREHPTLHEDILKGLPKRTAIHTFAFLQMSELRNELSEFLADSGLPRTIIENPNEWKAFYKLLIKILLDQPIEPDNAYPRIKYFKVSKVDDNYVVWAIKFADHTDKGIITFRETF